jgi:hypothetical protein
MILPRTVAVALTAAIALYLFVHILIISSASSISLTDETSSLIEPFVDEPTRRRHKRAIKAKPREKRRKNAKKYKEEEELYELYEDEEDEFDESDDELIDAGDDDDNEALAMRIARLRAQKEVLEEKNKVLTEQNEQLLEELKAKIVEAEESADGETQAWLRNAELLHGPPAIVAAQRESAERRMLREMRVELAQQREAFEVMRAMAENNDNNKNNNKNNNHVDLLREIDLPVVGRATPPPAPTPMNVVVQPPSGETVQVPFNMTVEFIEHFNRVSPWHNYDRFKAVVDGGHCIPLVVRAHRRTANMRQQLERLEKVARINETVLIVSHDSLEPDLIRLVANISFMAVKQIVNPHSANIWLDRFPGTDNATTPDRWDQFKHRRNNGVFPGMKHHFWWHLHHVWEHVVSPNVTDILMMEEDHVPTFDFYVALRSLVRSLPIMCPSCAGVVMGHHTNWDTRAVRVNQGAAREFIALGGPFSVSMVAHNVNVGLTMSRNIYHKLREHNQAFCLFGDYNWDVTLEHLRFRNLLPQHYLYPTHSRLHHNGLCGAVHDLWGGQCARFEGVVLRTVDETLDKLFRGIYNESRIQYKLARRRLNFTLPSIPAPPVPVAAPGKQPSPPPKAPLHFEQHKFTFEDDDEEFPIDMIQAMWWPGYVAADKPVVSNSGNGGFAPVDQALCSEMERLAPPVVTTVSAQPSSTKTTTTPTSSTSSTLTTPTTTTTTNTTTTTTNTTMTNSTTSTRKESEHDDHRHRRYGRESDGTLRWHNNLDKVEIEKMLKQTLQRTNNSNDGVSDLDEEEQADLDAELADV